MPHFCHNHKICQNQEISLGLLGNCYLNLGETSKAIEFYEQALAVAYEIEDRQGEGAWLGNLGAGYLTINNAHKAIECHEKALFVLREIGDIQNESINLENIGHAFLNIEAYQKADENYRQAIQIADEISFPTLQLNARWGLTQAYLFQNDLVNAHATIEAALQYDVPENNHNATALHGIIALRQGQKETAQEAFMKSIAQADEILAKTPDYYEALDAKGLALCGLALTTGDSHLRDDCHLQAIETFRAARVIAPHAGIVKRNLRLFDELAKCDPEGRLEGVRAAVEGVEG